MNDPSKTNRELVEEISFLKQRIKELEQSESDRTRAEAALRESEEKYRSLFENAIEGIFQSTPEGRFLTCNPAFAHILGYASPEELMSSISDIPQQYYVSHEDRKRYMEILEDNGSVKNFEFRARQKDGSEIWISNNTRTIVDEGGKTICYEGIVQDISTRKQADRALKESEARLSGIIEFLPDATLAIDLEGKVISWNRAIEVMTGFPAETMIGKGDHEYAIPFYGSRRPILIDFLFSWNEDIAKQYSFIHKEGDTLFMETDTLVGGQERVLWAKASPLRDHHGNIIGAIESIRDVTEHKRAEDALRESEERYRIAIEESNDGVAIVQNLVHVYVNRRFLHIFGYERAEGLLDAPSYFNVHPDDRERVKNYALMRGKGEDAPAQYEFKGIRRDGTWLNIEASVNTISYLGKPAILAYFRDITAKKQAEEQILVEQRKFASLLESSPFGVAVVSAEGVFSYVNAKFHELFGYDLADVPDGRTWFRKAYPEREYRKKVIAAWLEDTGGTMQGERTPRLFAITCKAATEKMVNIITVKMEAGEYLLTFEDRTELHRYQQNLEYFAIHDILTGLLNRRSLEDMLTRAIAKAKRGTTSSLLYMDLDNFKDVNDTIGHSAGDEVLITLTGLLRAVFRREDVLFRLGGDEFAALLDGISSKEAFPAAERLRSVVDTYRFELDHQVFSLSLSVGLIGIDGTLETGELLSKADAAMYRAKEQGKNRVVVAP